ncbi:hypothetical protein H6778_00810 [Candidatus Nomurabacteria bacterium]|nr:hypothetical protein [Candidatus Nomurabacteria bacterium]
MTTQRSSEEDSQPLQGPDPLKILLLYGAGMTLFAVGVGLTVQAGAIGAPLILLATVVLTATAIYPETIYAGYKALARMARRAVCWLWPGCPKRTAA